MKLALKASFRTLEPFPHQKYITGLRGPSLKTEDLEVVL